MDTPNFTPGPWHIEEWDGESRAVLVGGDKRYALVPAKGEDVQEGQTRANADLCAAAPDLYVVAAMVSSMYALEREHENHDSGAEPEDCCVWTKARLAIAKAGGKP